MSSDTKTALSTIRKPIIHIQYTPITIIQYLFYLGNLIFFKKMNKKKSKKVSFHILFLNYCLYIFSQEIKSDKSLTF